MSIQYIHRVSEKLAPDLGLSEKLPPSRRAFPYCVHVRHQIQGGNYPFHTVSLIQCDFRLTGRLAAAMRRHTESKTESTDQLVDRSPAAE